MHSFRKENPLVHGAKRRAYPQRDLRLTQNVALQIDARCDLSNCEPFQLQFHYASFGDINNILALLSRPPTAECDMFDLVDKLAILTFLENSEFSALDPRVETARREITTENDRARSGRDIDEAAGPCSYRRAASLETLTLPFRPTCKNETRLQSNPAP